MRRISGVMVSVLFLFNECLVASPVNQYAPCWFIGHDPTIPTLTPPLQPNQMIFEEWTPDTDPYLKTFYRGLPKKRERFPATPSNQPFSIVPLMAFFANTTPTQWTSSLDTQHLFWNWNLLGDSFVYFGGADSQGQLVIPPAGLIRAAHLRGVSIYGTVFFSESTPISWVESFVAKNENRTYPAADRLLAMAQSYNLDGFFINQESTEYAPYNKNFIPFFQYFNDQSQALRQGQSPIKLSWYDLNAAPDLAFMEAKSSLFLDYGWSADDTVRQWVQAAMDEKLPLSDLQFGINMEKSDHYTFPGIMTLVQRVLNGGRECQCGLFDSSQMVMQGQPTAPDLSTAIMRVGAFYDGGPTTSVSRYSSIPNPFHFDLSFRRVVGFDGMRAPKVDPIIPVQTLPCVANSVTAYSSLIGDGFSSTFNMGQGNHFFIQGNLVRVDPWWEPGLQDLSLLPQWFLPEGAMTSQITPSYNTQAAYTGGSSLNWSGTLQMDAAVTYTLYHTKLSVQTGSLLQVAYWGGHQREALILETEDGGLSIFELNQEAENQWSTQSFIIDENLQVKSIKIRFRNSEKGAAINFNLGFLALGPQQIPVPLSPTGLLAKTTEATKSVLLTWDPMEEADAYEIRLFSDSNTSIFIARVSTPAYFFSSLSVGARLGVASVGKTGTLSAFAETTVSSALQEAIDDDWQQVE